MSEKSVPHWRRAWWRLNGNQRGGGSHLIESLRLIHSPGRGVDRGREGGVLGSGVDPLFNFFKILVR